jgi:DNA-binding CsgD family transcriptional regulator
MGAAGAAQILCPVVVGRNGELEQLRVMLAAARHGHGGVLAFVGEAGIGKSRLARVAQDDAVADGMLAIKGRAAPSAAPVPYRPLAEAFRAALRPGEIANDPNLAPYRPGLRRFFGEQTIPAAEPSIPVVYDAVLGLVRGLQGRSGGIVLVLEDLHWADAETLGALEFLSDRMLSDPVLCIVTLRDDPGPALDLIEACAARRSVKRVRLRRLSADETAEMVRASLDAAHPEGPLLDAIASRAEGVPFVIEEMLTEYVASGGANVVPSTLPHTYRELVRARLQALSSDARDVLFAAAVLGRRFDWTLLSAMTSLPREAVLDALRTAVRENLVSSDPAPGLEMPFAFRHALVREAILQELLPPELQELAARAADVIEDRYPGLPGEWCERVADLREMAGQGAKAATQFQEAAQRALVRGALSSAESMLEHARLLVVGDRWHRIGIDRQLVEVLSLAGKIERLQEVATAAIGFVLEKRSTMPGVILGVGYLHLRLARGLATAGDDAGADEHLARARDVGIETGEPKLLTRIRGFEAARALERGDVEGARTAAQEATEQATLMRLKDVLAEALSVEGNAAFLSGDGESALATLKLARDEAGDEVVPRIRALLDLGSVEAAITGDTSALTAAAALAADAGATSSEARAQILSAEAAISRYDLEAAAGLLARAIDTSRRYGLAMFSDALRIEAEHRALAVDEAKVDTAADDLEGPARAHLVLSLRTEDHEGALLAAAALQRDHVSRAAGVLLAVLDDELALPFTTADSLARGLLACAGAIAEDGKMSADRYERADEMLQRFPWWRHVARRLVAEHAIARGWGDGVPWIRESLAFFEEIGHERLASACKAILRAAGAPVPRKGRGDSTVSQELRTRGVTSREMDVLRLVGRGLTNAAIAKNLFLSRRTVETHVASLLRKLDAQTREELIKKAGTES